MKKTKLVLLTMLAVFLTLSVCAVAVVAEETTYEGSDLPVSESYVLRVIDALEARVYAKIDTMIESVTARLDAMENRADTSSDTAAPTAPAETETAPTAAASVDYTVVYVTKGQSIVGSCEIILRSGTAVACCPGANGISDLTGGADLAGGTKISANHLLLVPRDDGRGITVTSADAYVMVRGAYTVTDAAE